MQTLREFHENILEALIYGGNAGALIEYVTSIRGAELRREKPNRVDIHLSTLAARDYFNPSGSILEIISAVSQKIAQDTGTSFNAVGRVNDRDTSVDFKVLKQGRQVCEATISITRNGISFMFEKFDRAERGQRDRSAQNARRQRQAQRQTPPASSTPAPTPRRGRPSPVQRPQQNDQNNENRVLISEIEGQGDGDRFYFGMVRFSDIEPDGNQYVQHIDFLEEEVHSSVAYAAVEKTHGGSIPRVGTAAQVQGLLKVSNGQDFDAFTVLNKDNIFRS